MPRIEWKLSVFHLSLFFFGKSSCLFGCIRFCSAVCNVVSRLFFFRSCRAHDTLCCHYFLVCRIWYEYLVVGWIGHLICMGFRKLNTRNCLSEQAYVYVLILYTIYVRRTLVEVWIIALSMKADHRGNHSRLLLLCAKYILPCAACILLKLRCEPSVPAHHISNSCRLRNYLCGSSGALCSAACISCNETKFMKWEHNSSKNLLKRIRWDFSFQICFWLQRVLFHDSFFFLGKCFLTFFCFNKVFFYRYPPKLFFACIFIERTSNAKSFILWEICKWKTPHQVFFGFEALTSCKC